MKSIILMSYLCSNPQIVNYTKVWNAIDKANLASAKTRCVELYDDAPCVKKFIKTEELTYRVICGDFS